MDNFKIDVVSEGSGPLRDALNIALTTKYGLRQIRGCVVHPTLGLVLLEHNQGAPAENPMIPFPFKPDLDMILSYVTLWLENGAVWPPEPGHDGSNGRGWRVYTEGTWGHVGSYRGAVCAIKPNWAWYGK